MKVWHPGMTDKETADLAYWERNMLALRYADGWYYDDVPITWASGSEETAAKAGYALAATHPRYPGWRRVLTLDDGKITFHIPDDFDVGPLRQVESNWDGHTTEEKWQYVRKLRGLR